MKKLVLWLLLLCAAPNLSWAALAHVQTTKGVTSAGTVATTTAITTTTGNLFVVTVGAYQLGAQANSVITDAATACASPCNTWVQVTASPKNPNANTRVQQFYAKNITGGANHVVTATITGGTNYMTVMAMEISGADTTAPFDVSAGATGDSAAPSSGATATRAQADSILVGSVGTADTISSNTISAGTNFIRPTNGFEASYNNYVSMTEYQIVASAGTDAATATMTSEPWGAIVGVYKAAGGAPATPIRHRSTQ